MVYWAKIAADMTFDATAFKARRNEGFNTFVEIEVLQTWLELISILTEGIILCRGLYV